MARTSYGLPGIYNATPLTLEDGDGAALALDSSGHVLISTGGAGTLSIEGVHDEDSAFQQGDKGFAVWAVRNDALFSHSNDGDYTPFQVDSTGRLYVTNVAQVTPTNRSGTIATGGAAQQLMAANANRKGFWVQNVSAGDLWISDIGAATVGQPSMKLLPDAVYESKDSGVPVSAISIIGATLGQQFSAREW